MCSTLIFLLTLIILLKVVSFVFEALVWKKQLNTILKLWFKSCEVEKFCTFKLPMDALNCQQNVLKKIYIFCRTLGWDSTGLKHENLSQWLAFFQLKTMQDEKTLIAKFGESQTRSLYNKVWVVSMRDKLRSRRGASIGAGHTSPTPIRLELRFIPNVSMVFSASA